MKTNKSGFTLIELLVVIAIIGLLASVIVVGMGNARLKSRDAKRLSDIQQIKLGLDIYFNTGAGYPDTATWDSLQATHGLLSCNSVDAFRIPQDPYNNGNPAYAYVYTQEGDAAAGCGGTTYSDYKVQFETEGLTSYGPAGTYWLSDTKGITSTDPF